MDVHNMDYLKGKLSRAHVNADGRRSNVPTSDFQQELNDSEDTKLAVDSLRALFCVDGQIQPKHRIALDVLARFCKVRAYDYKTNETEILRMTGRREVYNYIMFCLEYPVEERRKLAAQIERLEGIRDGRRTDNDDD